MSIYKYIVPILALVLIGGGCANYIEEVNCDDDPSHPSCVEKTALEKALEWSPWEETQRSANRIANALYGDDWDEEHGALDVNADLVAEEHGFVALYTDALSRRPIDHFKGYAASYLTRHSDAYTLYELERYESEFRTDVEAVFYKDVIDNRGKEIFVLVSQMTGIGPEGATPWYETVVYALNEEQTGYFRVKSIEEQLSNLYPSEAVKEKLNQL